MITNDRQYKVAQERLQEFKRALESFSYEEFVAEGIHPDFINAHKASIRSEIEAISESLDEYDALVSGQKKSFVAESIRDLPRTLIQARVAAKMTQKKLAERLCLKEQQIQRYEAARYMGASLERLIEVADALGVSFPGRAVIEDFQGQKGALAAEKYPVSEMAKRGWFDDFGGNSREAKKDAENLVSAFFARSGVIEAAVALHRKSACVGNVDEFALLAWQARVMLVADDQSLPREFDLGALTDEWVAELVHFSPHPEGPRLAAKHLENAGIHFVIEPHLPKTRLDGAAMVSAAGSPIIGLTLRYDRIDNFWFTLLHEVGHLKKHVCAGRRLSVIFDDLDVPIETDLEREADHFASNAIWPSGSWQKCISRFGMTPALVINDANKLKIHPAIVAGRLRKEKSNYTIFQDLLGQGDVRKLFATYEGASDV